MKIAIIGGGAAGMVTAYLLDKKGHQVEVFEKAAFLGGNIRTLNKNIKAHNLKPNLFLEGGVIEFSDRFVNFRGLLDELKISYENLEVGTGIFPKNAPHYLSSIMNKNNHKGITRIRENFKLWSLYLTSLSLSIKLKNNNTNDVCGQTLHQVLNGDKLRDKWLKLLMMYSYSSPYQFTSDFPAELALYNLQNYMMAGWYRIKGGVYSYVEAILKAFQGKIHLNSQINRVEREIKQVKLITQGGECLVFDKVVFATPPDQILKLLAKPTKEEQTFLSPWQANQVVTSIHEDPSMYKPFKINSPSEFDFFETETGWGYNAILNQVCGIPDQNSYFLSYNLDDRIDPDKVISRQKHHTPFYSVKAMKHRSNLIKANGQKNTCFAGAWLHDGLHEGATVSAKRVAELITR